MQLQLESENTIRKQQFQPNYMNSNTQKKNNRNLELKFETLTRKLNLKTKYEIERKSKEGNISQQRKSSAQHLSFINQRR